MLFKEFGGVDALPICLDTKDTDEIVDDGRRRSRPASAASTSRTSPRRAASRSSERLRAALDIPVFHDDQHGTAIVVARRAPQRAASRRQAPRGREGRDHRRRRRGHRRRPRCCSPPASRDVVGCDRGGAIHRGRDGPRRASKLATPSARTPRASRGSATRRSRAPTSSSASPARARSRVDGIARWPNDPIVFAMANPTPEIVPEEIAGPRRGRSRPAAPTTRTRSTTCSRFPGVFRGALDVRARAITEEMKLAAAHAIAAVVGRRARRRVHHPERLQPRRRARSPPRSRKQLSA